MRTVREMIDLPSPRRILRPWIICDTGDRGTDRWLFAVRRFAPELMPPPLIPAARSATRAQVRAMLVGMDAAVVLWQVHRESLPAACDCLAQTAVIAPGVLQLIGGSKLYSVEQIVLSEFPCAALLRHPEDLRRLAPMIHGYFAKNNQDLD